MLITILSGLFVLGVAVLVHEIGHFVVAKLSGVYVKTFSIGFGKKVLYRRVGETVYALSALPFGGYVKFAGESEYAGELSVNAEAPPAATDDVPDSEIPKDRYYTTKPKIVRAAVLFAGPFMNYVLAVVIYVGVLAVQGIHVYPTTTIGDIVTGGAGENAGLHVGDQLVAIDGEGVHDWWDVEKKIVDAGDRELGVQLLRAGTETTVVYRAQREDGRVRTGIAPIVPAVVGRVQKDNPAYAAGMRPGAVIQAINDTTVATYEDVRRMIHVNPGIPVYVRWSQDGVVHGDTIVPATRDALKPGSETETVKVGLIGITPQLARKPVGIGYALKNGFDNANGVVVATVGAIGNLVTRKTNVKTLGGPILITQMAGDWAKWGFDYLLSMVAFLSINLGVFNLLPVVPFDGGHLTILGIEAVARRPLNRRVREWVMQGGFILIILLMLFVLVLDIGRCSGAISS